MKKIVTLFLALVLVFSLFSCNFQSDPPVGDNTPVNIGVMSGPTGMGMAKLMADNKDDASKYLFEI